MKGLLIICGCIYLNLPVNGQENRDFAYIDNKVQHIPSAETFSTSAIAGYMRSNFKTDQEKLRAIYTWVITNISYDTDSMYHINWSMDPDAKISATLRRRRGVCENYATLFTDIAMKSGFYAQVVNGYTSLGTGNKAGHSWCAVQLQDKWFLCDPTWDIDYKGNTKYFLVAPIDFIETHMPFDPLWQLLEYPVTDHEFKRGSFSSKKDKHIFNFKDSAKAFFQLDSLQQLENSNRRIKQSGIENDRQKNWLAYSQMKIASIYGEKDMNLYNSAVADLNEANAVFNDYVKYRNNRFIPVRPDVVMSKLLDDIPMLISSAKKKLEQVGQTVENFQYDTSSIISSLNKLSGRVTEQKSFLKKYLSLNGEERSKSFYK